jgi:hypothetical protein
MKTRCKTYRNGWTVIMDKGSTLYSVIVRNARGDVHDKMRCDDYRDALDYYHSFKAIARNA